MPLYAGQKLQLDVLFFLDTAVRLPKPQQLPNHVRSMIQVDRSNLKAD